MTPERQGNGQREAVEVVEEVEEVREEENVQVVETMDPWMQIQSLFVDDPTGAVHEAAQQARREIEELMRRIEAKENELAGMTSGGSDVSTDDLRRCLTAYRDFARGLRRVTE